MTVNKSKHGKNYSPSGLMLQTFPKFRVWLKNSSVTIKWILQNSKIHMEKVKKRCNIEKSLSGLLTAPRTNCFQKITSGWTPTIRSTRMRVCKNFKKPQHTWQDSICSKQMGKNIISGNESFSENSAQDSWSSRHNRQLLT